jgi:predicted transposase YdaD
MRESVIYQDIEEQGVKKGVKQGIKQGAQQEAIALVLRLLKRRLGTVNPQLETRVRNLSVEQLEALGVALFDLSTEPEIWAWLERTS